ncbi:MAG: hypothetical protein AAF729_02055 [Pseudomonadota bacterium]
MMEVIVETWWIWLAAGLALAVIELLLPSFIFLGFAIGAAAMAVIVGILQMPMSGLVTLLPSPFTPSFAIALFAGLSLLAWIGLRVVFGSPFANVRKIEHDIND